MRRFFILFLVFSFLSCGEEEEAVDTTGEGPSLVIASGSVFATPDISAASGATVTIINNDDSPHTVTSESAESAFDETGDFDVTVSSEGTALLTLPEAPSGTVFFYYCRFHLDSMNPSSGTITIE
ncbi:MAG: hypothetical protein HY541_03025 [Deltaproteobacteria bacterium]|nr:hypothetical protein [Deltaproteobacteria bacterium]